jgi:hypothetical protein
MSEHRLQPPTKGTKDDANVKLVYAEIKGLVNDDNLETSDIINLVVKLIPIIQKIVVGRHEGAYKKLILITVLELVIEDSNLDDSAKSALNLVVQTTIPFTIDTMINIANGNIDLAKHVKGCFGCF